MFAKIEILMHCSAYEHEIDAVHKTLIAGFADKHLPFNFNRRNYTLSTPSIRLRSPRRDRDDLAQPAFADMNKFTRQLLDMPHVLNVVWIFS